MEFIGWLSTSLILCGYIINAIDFKKLAMIIWLIGDVGWVYYDIHIQNLSHMTLSLIIIAINIYGIYRIIFKKNNHD
jgi:hypothetical protein